MKIRLLLRSFSTYLLCICAGIFVGYAISPNEQIIHFIGAIAGTIFARLILRRTLPPQPRPKQNDQANVGPIGLLVIALATIGFQAIIFSEEYAQESFLPTVDTPDCTDVQGGFFGDALATIACYVRVAFISFANVFLVIYGISIFLANAFTFNVPGAPWYVRIIFTAIFAGGIGLALAGLFRGTEV